MRLLFHALAAGVTMRDAAHVDALLIKTRSGRRAISAQVFIDASGDRDLLAWAGAPREKGDTEGETLYPTLTFRVAGVDEARAILQAYRAQASSFGAARDALREQVTRLRKLTYARS